MCRVRSCEHFYVLAKYCYLVNRPSVVTKAKAGWTDGDFTFHVVYLCFLLLEKLKVKAKFGFVLDTHFVLWFIFMAFIALFLNY